MRRAWFVGAVAAALFCCWCGAAVALGAVSPGWECVPARAGLNVTSGGTGSVASCSSGTAVRGPTYGSSGVGGKATVQFSGVNVQIVDGSGSTSSVNGTGNLVLGYDESAGTQTGSHDLVLGEGDSYSSYSGLVAGYKDDASASYASVLGESNSVSSSYATV